MYRPVTPSLIRPTRYKVRERLRGGKVGNDRKGERVSQLKMPPKNTIFSGYKRKVKYKEVGYDSAIGDPQTTININLSVTQISILPQPYAGYRRIK